MLVPNREEGKGRFFHLLLREDQRADGVPGGDGDCADGREIQHEVLAAAEPEDLVFEFRLRVGVVVDEVEHQHCAG